MPIPFPYRFVSGGREQPPTTPVAARSTALLKKELKSQNLCSQEIREGEQKALALAVLEV